MIENEEATAVFAAIQTVNHFARAQNLDRADGLCGPGVMLVWDRHSEFVTALNGVLNPAGLKAGTIQTNEWIALSAIWRIDDDWGDTNACPLATLGVAWSQD